MSLAKIGDPTSSNYWDTVLNAINPNSEFSIPKQLIQKTISQKMHHHTSRYASNGHSGTFNFLRKYPDHHQLNVMDYVKYLHDTGHPIGAIFTGRDYRLNPNAKHSHQMSSVSIELHPYYKYNKQTKKWQVNTSAQYHGHLLTNATWKRYSFIDNGGDEAYRNNGFDSLSNFMIMYHNNYANEDNQLEPSLDNPATRKWANNKRMQFITGYYKKYGTYQTHFRFDDKQRLNMAGPKVAGQKATSGTRFIQQSDGKYHDLGKYRNKSFHYWDMKTSAYRYLTQKRGLSKYLVHNLLATGDLRSYDGYRRYAIFDDVSPKDVKAIQSYQHYRKGVYDAKNHQYKATLSDNPPKVEFAWHKPEMKKQAIKPGDAKQLLASLPKGKKKFVQNDIGEHVLNGHPYVHIVLKPKSYRKKVTELAFKGIYQRDKNGKPVKVTDKAILSKIDKHVGNTQASDDGRLIQLKDYPGFYIKKEPMTFYQDAKKNVYAGMYQTVPTGKQETVGADRIWLQPSKKEARAYTSKKARPVYDYDANNRKTCIGNAKIETVYTPANGQADNNMFSRGKQIARNSLSHYGFNFKSGTGRDCLYVFEDPIDAMSFYNMNETSLKHVNATFMSLGGVGKTSSINHFLELQHAKPGEFSKVYLCPDNDIHGHAMVANVMASERNKINFVKRGSKYISPVTHSTQEIDMNVPGVFVDPRTRMTHPYLSSNFGRTTGELKKVNQLADKGQFNKIKSNWKDYNDVLQMVRGDGKYKNLKQTGLWKDIVKHPTQNMNIGRYSKMLVDTCMNRVSRPEQKKMKVFFKHCNGLEYRTNRHSSPVQIKASVRNIQATYKTMQPKTQNTLLSFLRDGGGRDMSSHDILFYANTHDYGRTPDHDNSRIRQLKHEAAFNVGHANMMNASTYTFGQGVAHNVQSTMNHLQSTRYKQAYDLALQAHSLAMSPPKSPKTKDLTLNKIYQQGLAKEGQALYKGTMSALANVDHVPYMQIRDSIDRSLGDAYQQNPGMSYKPVSRASRRYLKRNHIKPVSFRDALVNSRSKNPKLYAEMIGIRNQYNQKLEKEFNKLQHAKSQARQATPESADKRIKHQATQRFINKASSHTQHVRKPNRHSLKHVNIAELEKRVNQASQRLKSDAEQGKFTRNVLKKGDLEAKKLTPGQKRAYKQIFSKGNANSIYNQFQFNKYNREAEQKRSRSTDQKYSKGILNNRKQHMEQQNAKNRKQNHGQKHGKSFGE